MRISPRETPPRSADAAGRLGASQAAGRTVPEASQAGRRGMVFSERAKTDVRLRRRADRRRSWQPSEPDPVDVQK